MKILIYLQFLNIINLIDIKFSNDFYNVLNYEGSRDRGFLKRIFKNKTYFRG